MSGVFLSETRIKSGDKNRTPGVLVLVAARQDMAKKVETSPENTNVEEKRYKKRLSGRQCDTIL